jgi:hypothetical protein
MLSALQQRVRALEGELNAARGEAAIIRSNATKAQQQHDAEVSRLKKLSAEQMAKQERIVEAAVAAEKTASTELQFLQRDLKEVNDRARRKDTGGTGMGGSFANVTPKKTTKTWGFADGFDDMDLVPSPSKGQGRGKAAGSVATNVGERTPTKGKRKRPTVDSPIMALETHTGDGDFAMEDVRTHSASTHTQQTVVVQIAPTPPFDVRLSPSHDLPFTDRKSSSHLSWIMEAYLINHRLSTCSRASPSLRNRQARSHPSSSRNCR